MLGELAEFLLRQGHTHRVDETETWTTNRKKKRPFDFCKGGYRRVKREVPILNVGGVCTGSTTIIGRVRNPSRCNVCWKG